MVGLPWWCSGARGWMRWPSPGMMLAKGAEDVEGVLERELNRCTWWGEQARHDGLGGLWSAENSTRGIFFFFQRACGRLSERAEAQWRRATSWSASWGETVLARDP